MWTGNCQPGSTVGYTAVYSVSINNIAKHFPCASWQPQCLHFFNGNCCIFFLCSLNNFLNCQRFLISYINCIKMWKIKSWGSFLPERQKKCWMRDCTKGWQKLGLYFWTVSTYGFDFFRLIVPVIGNLKLKLLELSYRLQRSSPGSHPDTPCTLQCKRNPFRNFVIKPGTAVSSWKLCNKNP